jgi:predicted transcriptional regulator
MSYVNCEKLIKISLPAVRIAVASGLHEKYGKGQEEIADRLGITQASVSKYFNGRYSRDIAKLAEAIKATRVIMELERESADEDDYSSIKDSINRMATEKPIIRIARRLFGNSAFE